MRIDQDNKPLLHVTQVTTRDPRVFILLGIGLVYAYLGKWLELAGWWYGSLALGALALVLSIGRAYLLPLGAATYVRLSVLPALLYLLLFGGFLWYEGLL